MAPASCLRVPENLRLLPQPAYAPELMPLSGLTFAKHYDNRTFRSLDVVEDTICDALKELIDQPERYSQ